VSILVFFIRWQFAGKKYALVLKSMILLLPVINNTIIRGFFVRMSSNLRLIGASFYSSFRNRQDTVEFGHL